MVLIAPGFKVVPVRLEEKAASCALRLERLTGALPSLVTFTSKVLDRPTSTSPKLSCEGFAESNLDASTERVTGTEELRFFGSLLVSSRVASYFPKSIIPAFRTTSRFSEAPASTVPEDFDICSHLGAVDIRTDMSDLIWSLL